MVERGGRTRWSNAVARRVVERGGQTRWSNAVARRGHLAGAGRGVRYADSRANRRVSCNANQSLQARTSGCVPSCSGVGGLSPPQPRPNVRASGAGAWAADIWLRAILFWRRWVVAPAAQAKCPRVGRGRVGASLRGHWTHKARIGVLCEVGLCEPCDNIRRYSFTSGSAPNQPNLEVCQTKSSYPLRMLLVWLGWRNAIGDGTIPTSGSS